MASSGTMNGTQSGTRPYLRLRWDIRSQDVANNRSRVRLRLYLVAPYKVSYSANKKGRLSGSDFTHTSGMSGTGEKLIRTQEVWTNHNSDGSKTATYSAWYDININFGGSYLGRLNISGTASLDAIPRKSTASLSSFTIGDNPTIRVSRASSNFRHRFNYYHGNNFIGEWYVNSPTSSTSPTLTMEARHLDRLYSSTRNRTYIDLTGRVTTISNGKSLGSTTFTTRAHVGSSVVPKINSSSVEVAGNGWDKRNNVYVQGVSKALAKSNSTAGRGADTSRREIWIGSEGRGSGGANWSLTTKTLTQSGTHKVEYKITDTRGRTASRERTFNVEPYSAPALQEFTVRRSSSNPNQAVIQRKGFWYDLNKKNELRIKIERRSSGNSSWSTVENSYHNSGSFSSDKTDVGLALDSSYEYKITISDDIGSKFSSIKTLSTAKVLMDLNKDIGVGVGKIHEQGILDIAGDVFFGAIKNPIITDSGGNSKDGYVKFGEHLTIMKMNIDSNKGENFIKGDFAPPIPFNSTEESRRAVIIPSGAMQLTPEGNRHNTHYIEKFAGTGDGRSSIRIWAEVEGTVVQDNRIRIQVLVVTL